MSRGRLVPRNLDDRKWQDIVDEARALIPKYAPEWTDHNPSDLGITLIELFAWLVEGMIYRLNRVPDKNFIEFLNLLGITRDPATPASTVLTYGLASGMPPTVLPKGSQAGTQETESEAAIVFETNQDLTLLPVNLATALLLTKSGATALYKNITTHLVASPLSGMTIDIPANQAVMIALGFDMASTETIALRMRFSKPAQRNDINVAWQYSRDTSEPSSWPAIPAVNDETERFQKDGTVSFGVPGDWGTQNPASWSGVAPETLIDQFDQPRFWIGVTISNLRAGPFQAGLEQILFNSVSATNALTVTQPELVGAGNGEPFQFFELRNRPLFKRPGVPDPHDHLIIQVREPLGSGGFGPFTDWTRVENFPEGPGNYFRLEPVSGTIYFGNHDPLTSPEGHGTIPPAGSEIRARTYRYVAGGAKGNVPSDVINIIRTPLAGLTGVVNFGSAAGGSDEESMEDTKRRGPEVLRNRYRAVTVEDYEYLAREATTDVKKVRCLPTRLYTIYESLPAGVSVGDPWTYGGLIRDVGYIHVIIIPEAPLNNLHPIPSEALLQEVSDYLEERRVLTNLLHVTFPRYLPINVAADIRVWQKALDTGLVASTTQVENDTRIKIEKYLHPIFGGLDETGWEVGQDIVISSLFEFIQPPSDVGFISNLTVQAGTPMYQPPLRPSFTGPPAPGVWVQVADYEIICNGAHTVSANPI